jgi:type I restriction enzyme S subunit
MPIALPKRQVQDEIAETIAILDKQIDHLNAKYNLQSDLFKTLLHELMTGQRRVNEIDFESSMSMAVEH